MSQDPTQRPYVQQAIQTQILYDLAGMMEELLERVKRIENIIPEGGMEEFLLDAPSSGIVYDNVASYGFPWRGFTLVNVGDVDIYLGVNRKQTTSVPIHPGDVWSIDFGVRVIRFIVLRGSGGTGKVRVIARW